MTLGTWAVIGGLGALAGFKIDAFALFFLLLGVVSLGVAAFPQRPSSSATAA